MRKYLLPTIITLLLFGSLIQEKVKAQDITGTEFWFTPTGGRWYIDQSTKLMIVGNYDATITLDFVALPHPGGTTNEFSCTAQTYNHVGGTVTTVLIPSDNLVYCARYVDDLSAPETIQNNGCLINSDAPIAVYYTHYEAASGEATPLHPTSRLGQDYYINAYRENSTDSYWAAVANLIATEDNTQITVTLSDETWTSSGDYRTNGLDLTDTVVKHKPGETWTFTMNRGQTYSMTSLQDGTNSSSGNAFPWGSTVPNKWNTGLNGVRVQSNKNIAVFGGSPITRIGDYEYLGCSAGDITFTNLLPTNEWGTKFVATQTLLRTYNITGLNAQGPPSYVNYPPTSADKSTADYLLITAKDNGTIITIGGRSAFTYNMDAGDYIIYESPGKSAAAQLNPGQVQNTITSNNPISVTQLMKGGYCDGAVATNGGDPDQMWVFKEDDWTDNYLMSNPTDYTSNFLVLIVKEPNGGTEARNSIAVSQNGVNVAIPAGVSSSPLQDGTGGWSRMGTTNYWFQRVQLNTVGVPVKAKSIPLTPGGTTYNFAFYMSGGLGAGSYGYMGGASCQLEAFASADGVPGCVGVPMDLNLDSTRNGGTLAGMNNYTYTWEVYNGTTLVHTFSGTGADPTYSYTPTVGGNLTVILDINDIAGCNARDTFQMFVNTRPDITDLADLSSCNNYLLPTIVGTDLTGNEAYYSGIGGTGTQFLPGSTITNGGTYYLYDSHSAACFDEEETAITINSSPIVNPASITTTCDAANVEYILEFTVSGGNGGPYTVTEIAPGGTGGSFTGAVYTTNAITSGVSYNFEVTDANGCPAAVVSGVKNCLCTSDAGTMSTTALSLCGDGNQSTTAGSVGPTLDGNDAMSFVLHTNSGGNLGTVLASNAGPNFSFLSGTMTYGTTYYISRVVGNDDGTGLVDLTDGCLSVASGTPVVWKEAVSAVISNNGPVCSGTSSSIDFSMTGPAPFNIVYNNGTSNQNILNATSNHNRVVTPTSTTTYTIVSVTSVANGCAANTSVGNSTSLIVNDQPIATNKLEDCDASNSNYRVSFDVSQGQAPYTVIVNSPAGIGGTFTGTTWTSDLIPSGTAYDFSLSDNNMCGATAITGQRTCLCLSESGAMVQAVLSTCGDGIQTAQQDPSQSPFLDANDALVFILHDSPNDVAGTILDVSLSPSFAFNSATMTYGTTYYISAVVGNNDGNGMVDPSDPCADVAFGTPVVWDEIPLAEASYNDPVCSGNTLQLFGSNTNNLPGTTYTWMGNMNYFSSEQNPVIPNVNSAMTGNMVLTAINGNCSSDASLAIQISQSAQAAFTPELLNGVTKARHYQFNNTSTNSNSYSWSFGDGESNTEQSPSHQYVEENGEALVTLIAFGENGCNDTLSIPVDLTVYPEMDTVLIFMPNSFTPDGNEYNQYFSPVFNESVDVTSYTMSIFNRWGQKIFESNDIEIGWDGSFDSQLVPSGVYTWVVTFTDKYTFKTYKYEGHINLLK